MIENIKKIMVDEYTAKYSVQLEQYKKQLQELENFVSTYSVENLIKERDELKKESGKFSVKFLHKKIFKQMVNQINEKSQLISKVINSNSMIPSVNRMIKNIEEEITQYINSLENMNLEQLGFSFQSACVFLKEHNIEPSLTPNDKKFLEFSPQIENNRAEQTTFEGKEVVGLEKMKDYVLVHKTRFYPRNGKIKTDKEVGLKEEVILSLDKIGSLKFTQQRNTIHFAVNGEVGKHPYGNWDDCKYAVVIPFTSMPINQLKCGAVMDTYIENGLSLPNDTIILCPIEELEMIRNSNPNVNILGYVGENAMNYADTLIGMMGYKVEKVGMWSWANNNDEKEYYRKLKDSGLSVHNFPHTYSIEKELEDCMNNVKAFESLIDKAIEEHISLSNDDLAVLIQQNNISLHSLEKTVQEEIFKEIIPFLNARGILISEDLVKKILYFNSIKYNCPNEENKNSEVYKEYCKLRYEQKQIEYPSQYVNSLLMKEIFGQLNDKLNMNEIEGKSR